MSTSSYDNPGNNLNDRISDDHENNHADDHWLVRPTTIKRLWWIFSIVLSLLVLAQAVIYVKGYVGVDGWFGFGAIFGFLSCLAMVLIAKGLGFVLKRNEDYYLDKNGLDKIGLDNNGFDNSRLDNNRLDENGVDENRVSQDRVDNSSVDNNRMDSNNADRGTNKRTGEVHDGDHDV